MTSFAKFTLLIALSRVAPARATDLAEKPVLGTLRAGRERAATTAPGEPKPFSEGNLESGKPVLRTLRGAQSAPASSRPGKEAPCWGEKPITRFLRGDKC